MSLLADGSSACDPEAVVVVRPTAELVRVLAVGGSTDIGWQANEVSTATVDVADKKIENEGRVRGCRFQPRLGQTGLDSLVSIAHRRLISCIVIIARST